MITPTFGIHPVSRSISTHPPQTAYPTIIHHLRCSRIWAVSSTPYSRLRAVTTRKVSRAITIAAIVPATVAAPWTARETVSETSAVYPQVSVTTPSSKTIAANTPHLHAGSFLRHRHRPHPYMTVPANSISVASPPVTISREANRKIAPMISCNPFISVVTGFFILSFLFSKNHSSSG